MPPLIGLTAYVESIHYRIWDEDAAFTPATYVDAVIRAGATPILLPPSPSDPAPVLASLDGLVVIGGPDVDPTLYGQDPHPRTGEPRKERDAWEMALCRDALEMDLPLLAVCRGIQVLNVALGGTLHQHVEDLVGHAGHMAHDHRMTRNDMTVEPGSRLAAILTESCQGMCHHHQAIDRLGDGLTVTARAADGTIEAVEITEKGFALGVQWHPEEDPDDDRLFAAFVAAGRNRPFFP